MIGASILVFDFLPKNFQSDQVSNQRDYFSVILFNSIIQLQVTVFAEPHQNLVAFRNSFILKV